MDYNKNDKPYEATPHINYKELLSKLSILQT